MDMVNLRELTKEKITKLYNERMVVDFPPDEQKPLSVILNAFDEGIYKAFGLYENEAIVGYTCLVKSGRDYLIDYLAIYPDKRNRGIGTTLLKILDGHMAGCGTILVEVEDPDYAKDEEDRKLRIRRMDFYLRNGCVDTGVRTRCFGVEFIILQMGGSKADKKKIWEKYSSFYRATLPKKMYDGNIEIKKAVRAKVKEGIDSRLCRGEEEEKDGNS